MNDVLLMAASLRRESFNKKLIKNVFDILKVDRPQVGAELLSFNDYPMPLLSEDDEAATGIPTTTQELAKKIAASRMVIFSTPEYNGGIPGTFKNMIDWLSRTKPNPFIDKPILLIGASPGALGAIRGLWHSRVPLEALGAVVYPEMFGLALANKAFDEEGKLTEPKQQERLKKLVFKFLEFFSQRSPLAK